jgi:hypothetical protein
MRRWRAIWGRICEVTSNAAAWLTFRLPAGGPAWNAARRLDHAAAEGAAHAHGWLPAGQRLPPGSYQPPPGYKGPAWARADAASRLAGAGARLSDLAFPGALPLRDAELLQGAFTRRRPRAAAGRAAAARAARARAAARPASV